MKRICILILLVSSDVPEGVSEDASEGVSSPGGKHLRPPICLYSFAYFHCYSFLTTMASFQIILVRFSGVMGDNRPTYWLSKFNLTLPPTKGFSRQPCMFCNYSRKMLSDLNQLTSGRNIIKRGKYVKFLGFLVDEHRSWKHLTAELCKKTF